MGATMQIFIRVNEGCAEQPLLLWDSVWDAQAGEADWALADPAAEPLNKGGLQATSQLETVVVLCLFSDKRAPEELCNGAPGPGGFPPRLDDGDPRGWWGDGIDVRTDDGETELGSHLWLLERAPLTEQVGRLAEFYAREALDPLLAQQACARIDVAASVNEIRGRLELDVDLYGRDGTVVYAGRFAIYWRRLADA